ncbi:MAG TPA: hypothetical protein VF623_14265 [Segetibacter sp.]|jgi:hypothetical protein
MNPTYSLQEVKTLIKTLDFSSITILEDLIEEEKECYSALELRALTRFAQLKNKHLVVNEVKAEYLLSFN